MVSGFLSGLSGSPLNSTCYINNFIDGHGDLCRNGYMKNIKFYRMNSGLTQLDVEKKINISNCWLSLLENGHRKPTDNVLKALAEVYGVSTTDLLGDFVVGDAKGAAA